MLNLHTLELKSQNKAALCHNRGEILVIYQYFSCLFLCGLLSLLAQKGLILQVVQWYALTRVPQTDGFFLLPLWKLYKIPAGFRRSPRRSSLTLSTKLYTLGQVYVCAFLVVSIRILLHRALHAV